MKQQHQVRIRGDRGGRGFGGVWEVGGGGELTRFGGASWRVGLGGKRRVFLWGKERVIVDDAGFVVGVRRGKGFECL